jgi:hypothetical protein
LHGHWPGFIRRACVVLQTTHLKLGDAKGRLGLHLLQLQKQSVLSSAVISALRVPKARPKPRAKSRHRSAEGQKSNQ